MDPRHSFPLPGTVPGQAPINLPAEKSILSLVSQEDVLKIPGQNYAVICVVVPKDGAQFALKIRGVYDTLDEATKGARHISMIDPFFDVHVVQMWNWLMLPPPDVPEGGRHYSNEEFEAIMKRYFSEMRDRQNKMKSRMEQAKIDAANNEHGPIQEGAVRTEIEYAPTEVRTEVVELTAGGEGEQEGDTANV